MLSLTTSGRAARRPASRLIATVASLAVLSGCSAGAGPAAIPASQAALQGQSLRAHGNNPPCTPNVWASQPGNLPQTVIGFNGNTPCVQFDGTSSGLAFADPYGLATDANGYLYVADAKNSRIVVFDKHGNYWSQLRTTAPPFGVCVSQAGVVGAANNFSNGTVDFFNNKGMQSQILPPNVTLSGTNHPNLTAYCAFDKNGDFFADNSYGAPISYLRNYNVNVPNVMLQTCTTALCNTNRNWSGMYSHIRPGTVNTLSVTDQTSMTVVNFKITNGAPNLLNFGVYPAYPTTAIGAFPGASICGVAPTTGQTNTSTLYLAACGNATVEQISNVNTGGTSSLFANVSPSYGVATHPTGQY